MNNITSLTATSSGSVFLRSNGTWSVPMNLVSGSCQPVSNYAWGGFDFLLYSFGLLVMVGAVYLACECYQQYHKPVAPAPKKR